MLDFPWFYATFQHFYDSGISTITSYNYAYFCLFLPSFVVNSKDLRHAPFAVRCRFLKSRIYYFLHFFIYIIIVQMCISIQGNTNLTMPHNILKPSLPRRVRDFHPLGRAHGAQTKWRSAYRNTSPKA